MKPARGDVLYSVPRRTKGPKVMPTKPDEGLGNKITETRSVGLAGGVRLVVALGDITCEKSDAVVNAANSKLTHGAGLARAIVKKGGPAIRKESDDWYREHGEVPTGDLALTSGGNMPAKWCLHVVGPIFGECEGRDDELLKQSVERALKRADELKCKSISLPALSSGLFRFPKDRCAEVLVYTAAMFAESTQRQGSLVEIRYTNFDSETVGYFERCVDRHFPAASGARPEEHRTAPSSAASRPVGATDDTPPAA